MTPNSALRAAPADPEAGDHLVEDQQRADPVALGPEPGEEARRPAATRPMLAATGSTMTHATVSSSVGHDVVRRDRRLGHRGRRARRPTRDAAGSSDGRCSATPLPPSASRASLVAVVVAGELHDAGAAGGARGRGGCADIVASVPLDTRRTFSQRRHPLA